ncbi:DsbA family protein [candidate division KSB1 bacterium]|nr:DsbA family protein [candidate division KSB1 bacterium]
MKKELIYIGDPMCSWCWGFSPVLQEIRKQFQDHLAFSVIVGGLRAGTSENLTEDLKQDIRGHWTEVNKMTGQPFSFNFFNRDNFIYNTEPACRAVVTIRNLKPNLVFSYFESLHHSFYVENHDITTTEVLSNNAGKIGVDSEAFQLTFNSRKIIDETASDFETARRMGVFGFPSLVLKEAEKIIPVSNGYCTFEGLTRKLDKVLNHQSF